MLILQRPWTAQPQVLARPNRKLFPSHGVLFNSATGPVDLVTGRKWTENGTIGRGVSNQGITRTVVGGAANSYYDYTGYGELTGTVGTFFIWSSRVGITDTFGHVPFSTNTGSSVYFQIVRPTDGRTLACFGSVSSTGLSSYFNTENTSLVLTSASDVAAGMKAYYNGSDTGITWSENPVAFSSGSKYLRFFAAAGGTSWSLDGSVVVIGYAHGVAWTAEQAKAFHDNPHTVYEPRRIYIPTAAAAGGAPTLSASTYVPGSLTSTGWRPQITAS